VENRISLFMVVAIFFAACATESTQARNGGPVGSQATVSADSKSKVDGDGVYRFENAPFAVKAPAHCLLNFEVKDLPDYVMFSTRPGQLTATGQYDLRLIKPPPSIHDEATFTEETKEFLPRYLSQDNKTSGLSFELKEEKQLQIGARPAYRGIAVAKGKAVFVATFVYHDNWITVAGLVYPLQGSRDATDQVPWKCYDEFVNSVQKSN
jgi:hypothetical protein